MEAPKENETETLIDKALREEPLRAATHGFARRLKSRLAIIALIEQERQRFGHFMATGGVLLGGTLGAVTLLFLFADLPGVLMRGIPGVMGYYDYFTTSMMTFWGGAVGAFALLLGFSLGLTALLTLRPGYK